MCIALTPFGFTSDASPRSHISEDVVHFTMEMCRAVLLGAMDQIRSCGLIFLLL